MYANFSTETIEGQVTLEMIYSKTDNEQMKNSFNQEFHGGNGR